MLLSLILFFHFNFQGFIFFNLSYDIEEFPLLHCLCYTLLRISLIFQGGCYWQIILQLTVKLFPHSPSLYWVVVSVAYSHSSR